MKQVIIVIEGTHVIVGFFLKSSLVQLVSREYTMCIVKDGATFLASEDSYVILTEADDFDSARDVAFQMMVRYYEKCLGRPVEEAKKMARADVTMPINNRELFTKYVSVIPTQ